MTRGKRGWVVWTGKRSGYVLTRDLEPGEVIFHDDFLAFGGEPEGEAGHPMPEKLAKAIAEGRE